MLQYAEGGLIIMEGSQSWKEHEHHGRRWEIESGDKDDHVGSGRCWKEMRCLKKF